MVLMNILILHGIMGRAGENWSGWLADKLSEKGFNVAMPNLSKPNHPNRTEWLHEITNEMRKLGDDTIIVAHSLGVTSALDFLEQHSGKIKGLVSVAGFADDYGLELNSYFMREKEIDFESVKNSVESLAVLYGDNDPYVPQSSLQNLAIELGAQSVVITGGGHLNEAAGYNTFPKLLDLVLEIAEK